MIFISTFSNDIISLNVLFTFILGLLAIHFYDKSTNKLFGILFVLFFGVIAELLKTDYGIYGVFLMFVFYFFKNKKFLMILSSIILMALYYGFYAFKFYNLKIIYIFAKMLLKFCFIKIYPTNEKIIERNITIRNISGVNSFS